MNLTFLGTDAFSVFALKGIERAKSKIGKLKVLTAMPTNRVNPVVQFAEKHGMDVDRLFSKNPLQNKAEFEDLSQRIIRRREQDGTNEMLLLCSFAYMVPNIVIDAFKDEAFVVHPSLLPDLPGCSPICEAILQEKIITGTSIITMSRNAFDQGDIVHQKSLQMRPEWRYTELYEELGKLSADAVTEFLLSPETYKSRAVPQKQTQKQTTKMRVGDNILLPRSQTAAEIERLYRAYFGSTLKTVHFELENNIGSLYVDHCSLVSTEWLNAHKISQEAVNSVPSGTVIPGFTPGKKNSLFVKCSDQLLEVTKWHMSSCPSTHIARLKEALFGKEDTKHFSRLLQSEEWRQANAFEKCPRSK